MRIAQVAPLYESVPPQGYGGTERIVSYLTEELVRRGHEVTLFASGDSRTRAMLIPVCSRALRLGRPRTDPMAAYGALLETVARHADDFDVIHAHIDWLHLPFLSRLGVPFLTTMHGRLDLPLLPDLVRLFEATCSTLREWTERLRAEAGDSFPEKVTAFRPGMAVHGRFGQPCPACGTAVRRIVYAENETNYCPRCQTGGKVLADRSLSRLLKDDWPRTLEEWEAQRGH